MKAACHNEEYIVVWKQAFKLMLKLEKKIKVCKEPGEDYFRYMKYVRSSSWKRALCCRSQMIMSVFQMKEESTEECIRKELHDIPQAFER